MEPDTGLLFHFLSESGLGYRKHCCVPDKAATETRLWGSEARSVRSLAVSRDEQFEITMDLSGKMAAPVCLIENSPEGKFVVGPTAKEILSKITQPVVVVAIVGLYRTGKSYLMNKLAGVNKGFELGATIQSHTKGIWMWCVPHPVKKDHTLVLLDTEGLGDVEKGDTKNDTMIFCLAVLLSSALVYNSKGTIDNDAIQKLHYVKELSDRIKVKSSDNEDDEAEFSRHFPIFIWTVRDFSLRLELEGLPVTEDEYLENALKLQKPETSLRAQNFNFPRKCLHMYFGIRKCFVFDRPVADNEILQKVEEEPEENLSPAFVAQSKKFCDYIFNNAEAKYLNGIHRVTGTILGGLTETYIKTISSGEITCMENAVLSLSESENKAAVQEASKHYEKEMRERAVFPTETMKQFMDLSGECEKEALQIFMSRSFKDKDHQFQTELMGIVQKEKREFSRQNEAASQKYCQSLIKKHSEDLEKAVSDASYSVPGGHQKFKAVMTQIVEKYNKEPGKGIQAEEVLQEFLKSKETIGITILRSDEALTEKEKEMEEVKAEAEAREMEKLVSEEKAAQEKQVMEDHKRTFEENMKQLHNKMEMERRKMQDDMDRIMFEKRREQQHYLREGFPDQANMYKAQIDGLQKEKGDMDDPAWYTPIVESFKSVVKTILPDVFAVGGDILKKGIQNYKVNL
ncbi:guanylate-binding protein 7-like isoform X2 [Ascaphus truei]|uniref:guanylate-binding protein 7-like isoform X2 n=1 Tax=Ascaphus truei TaxID=8439 RepID=UPI003F5A8C82